ncbi:alpha/beta fold hydrolase [Telmatocola sphagniphila]|uniref:Alpha/beta fold hydrolase n=2 Tax=Telmatocola sphagniphila TaxID=1123043 RepID=A0A8E6F0J0_9BACT|nr:alpha/beta fold hydrolase [Telmatocola sphagniphila]
MVHGNPTWSFYYRDLVLKLRDRYRCIVPDHIGCGFSDKPSAASYGYSLKERIDDLEALLQSLNLSEKITLVVHDWGGMIGFGVVARHPEWFRRFVVLNTAAFRLPASKKLPLALKLGRQTRLGELLIRYGNMFCLQAARIGTKRKPLAPAVREGLLAPYDSPADRIAIARFVQTIPLKPGDPGYDLVESVESILPTLTDRPMFVGWGMKDFVFDHHFLTEWKKRFPAAEYQEFPDCGHYILEDARSELLESIPRFLDQHPL